MSIISLSIFLAILSGGCFASWKGALLWNSRTRDARKEDPRDQEIRELSAALSVSRKQVETLDSENKLKDKEVIALGEKLTKAGYALTNSKQEDNASKEALDKEIESKAEFDAELVRLRRELHVANTRLAELDVEVKIASPGSGLVAGMDDVVEDDEKEMFTIRHEHKELKQIVGVFQQSLDEQKTESERWKKHCAVMTRTNKVLRSQVDELPQIREELERLRKQAELLVTTQEENSSLQAQITELSEVKAENEILLTQVAQLDSTLKKNDQLEELIQKQATEIGTVGEDNDNLRSQVASLSQVKDENQKLLAQIAEQAIIVDEHAGLTAQVEALRNIETENGTLLAQIRDLQQEGARRLEQAHAENAALQVRVEAIDKIQEENDRLLSQSKQLRQTQTLVETLRGQLEVLSGTNDENVRLQARVDTLAPVEEENAQFQTNINELKQEQLEQRNANNELGARIEKLTRDLKDKEIQVAQIDDLLLEQEENEKLGAQLAQISQAHELAQAESENLKLQLAAAGDIQQNNEKLSAELDELTQAQEQVLTEQAELKLKLAAAGNTEKENEKLQEDYLELIKTHDHLQAENDQFKQQLDKLDQSQEEVGGLQKQVKKLNSAQEDHLSRQSLIESELEHEKDENEQLTAQLQKLAHKLDARKAVGTAHDNVKSEKRTVDSADSADSGDDTDSMPALQMDDIHDDLKAIRGVGAKIEQKLNMLGIHNFKGLLQLESDDYDRAAELIPNLEGRMHRDAWIDQARNLHLEKYNEAI
jgi:predicted flap endonuclease-1-like 5' DNA nuclease